MTQVQLIARHTITPGHEAEVFALLAGFIDDARAEPGNLAFDSYRKTSNDRSYVLLERYVSREALAEHRLAPHFTQVLLGQISRSWRAAPAGQNHAGRLARRDQERGRPRPREGHGAAAI